jgi:eukaryotic-like serine/threonine-protein kinase
VSQALQPGSRISHYQIIGPLGAGGMGEVYRAKDETLGRDVALKILPPEAVRNEERVRRFILEAKSASSLSHPNIVTIHEIGHDVVRAAESFKAEVGKSPDGKVVPGASSEEGLGPAGRLSSAAGSDPVHFIAMELVTGETLGAKIHQEKTDLRTMLGYLAQAAEGLAKAHAAGIVHRDLKPGNIMVSRDGFAKVLDFGLAKLTERRAGENDLTATLTEREVKTGEGVVMGTTGYMSPEQVQGKPVDQRSDIFSFGSILYEAATRRNPFEAETGAERMAKILREKPAPIEELNPEAPAELRRLIRRCLTKDPNQRLDSMKALAIELREIVEEYDALSASASSGSGASATAGAIARSPQRTRLLLLLTAVAVAGIAGIVVGLRMIRQRGSVPETPPRTMRVNVVTSLSQPFTFLSALSRDGRLLAYVSAGGLWVRQVATGADVQVVPPPGPIPNSPNFSPDGNYLYYLRSDPEQANYTSLFEVPSMGGTPRKRAFEVDEGFTFAPDGRRVCFVRLEPPKNQSSLIVLDLESGQERTLATVITPIRFQGAPSWSWDGRKIAAVRAGPNTEAHLMAFDAENGKTESLISDPSFRAFQYPWLPDGTGLIVQGVKGPFAPGQLWLVPYPEGQPRMITAGDAPYIGVSVSSDGKTLATNRIQARGAFWTAESQGGRIALRRITPENRTFAPGFTGFDTAKNGSVLFMSVAQKYNLWTMGPDGSGRKPITSVLGQRVNARCLKDGGIILEQSSEDRIPHLWRVNEDGSNLRQLTSGTGEYLISVSPDSGTVLFQPAEHPEELWQLRQGSKPMKLVSPFTSKALFSPDGSRIAYDSPRESEGRTRSVWNIIPAGGGNTLATLSLPLEASGVQWAPDGNALTFVNGANVFRQRLEAGSPEPVTRFSEGWVSGHEWAPDGKRLLVQRKIEQVDNLWIVAADGSNPAQWTDFKTENGLDATWARDGRRIIFNQGEFNGDVLLIQDFR